MHDAPSSDEALMSAVAGGDMDALGELVRRHQGRAFRLARRVTGDADLAEDVVQDAFLRVHRAAGRYRPTAKFTTWLHRIVVNLCWDRKRKWSGVIGGPGGSTSGRSEVRTAGTAVAHGGSAGRMEPALRLEPADSEVSPLRRDYSPVGTPHEQVQAAETAAAVRRAVAALPPRQRLAVVLHRFEGYSIREAAEVTGWSESAVESCLVRGYRQLREDLAAYRTGATRPGSEHPVDRRKTPQANRG